jgi:hypothetical protein
MMELVRTAIQPLQDSKTPGLENSSVRFNPAHKKCRGLFQDDFLRIR